MIYFKRTTVILVFGLLLLSLPGAGQRTTPEHNRALLQAAQGTIVSLPGFLSERIPSIPYQKIAVPGPQYLISDDPEYIRVPEAIVLQEAVTPGAVRLYVYNVNGVKEPRMDRKITAVIKNTGTYSLQIRMLRSSSPKPSGNYFGIAKQALAEFLTSKPQTAVRTVKPGEAISIDPKLETYRARYDDLVHGFYEFVIDGPAEISVIQTHPATPGPQALRRIKGVHPTNKKNAGRGLFRTANFKVIPGDTLDTSGEPRALVLADGKTDPWIIGTESTSGGLSTLAGNYGVLYDVTLKWKSTDGRGLALVTWNARAGDNRWCGGMANAMLVSEGKFPGGLVRLPSDSLRTRGAPEAILIQVFPPAADSSVQTIRLTYSPPGASCLPTPLIFVPLPVAGGGERSY